MAEPPVRQDKIASITTTEKHNATSTLTAPHAAKKVRSTSQATETALMTASSVLDVVAKRLDEKATARSDEKSNPTRLFCDMIYQQLMTIPEEDRDMVQYEIHGIVIAHKRKAQHMNVSTQSQNMSNPRSIAPSFDMTRRSSECSSMSSALSSVSQSLYEDNSDNLMMTQYYSL